MVSLKDLLKFKSKVEIKGPDGSVLKVVWLKILGDEDLSNAYRLARIASSDKRKKLRNPETPEYKDEIEVISELQRSDLEIIIRQSAQNRYQTESFVKINRDELPTIESVAIEPDAPSLEEQEKLDALLVAEESDYQKRLDEYVEERMTVLNSTLADKTDAEVLAMAKEEMVNVLPLQNFVSELTAQKIYRGTFQDANCSKREFDSVDDFKQAHPFIKEQLLTEYSKLEIAPDEIKNS